MAEDWTYDGPEWIYLQPECDATEDGRLWCKDAINVPTEERQDQTEPTDCPYVRGDVYDAVVEKLAERDAEVAAMKQLLSKGQSILDRLRSRGWLVAVHNDYTQDGRFHTFWLLTKGSRFVKGEACNDWIALGYCETEAGAIDALTPEEKPHDRTR